MNSNSKEMRFAEPCSFKVNSEAEIRRNKDAI